MPQCIFSQSWWVQCKVPRTRGKFLCVWGWTLGRWIWLLAHYSKKMAKLAVAREVFRSFTKLKVALQQSENTLLQVRPCQNFTKAKVQMYYQQCTWIVSALCAAARFLSVFNLYLQCSWLYLSDKCRRVKKYIYFPINAVKEIENYNLSIVTALFCSVSFVSKTQI